MTTARAFFEIGTRTNFSFLEGASGPEEMVVQAARLRLGGLGIADRIKTEPDGSITAPATDEAFMREHFKEWKRLMKATPHLVVQREP